MTTNFTIKKAISYIKSELNNRYPDQEISSFTYLILEQVLNLSRIQIHMSNELIIADDLWQSIKNITSQLKENIPIQYIIGKAFFYDLSIHVTQDVLIPRPETEELVDWVIKESSGAIKKIIDIGTGSGCIAISLAKSIPGSIVYAADISNSALTITRKNSKLNNVDLRIIQLDILNLKTPLDEKFDVIVSNPPYVTQKEKIWMHKNVLDFEPELALFVPDSDPLIYYRKIIEFALSYLTPGGSLYFEINEAYGKEIALLLEENDFHNISLRKDMHDKDRMIRCIL